MKDKLLEFCSVAQVEVCTVSNKPKTYTIPLIDYIDMVAVNSGLNGYKDYSEKTIKRFIAESRLKFIPCA